MASFPAEVYWIFYSEAIGGWACDDQIGTNSVVITWQSLIQ